MNLLGGNPSKKKILIIVCSVSGVLLISILLFLLFNSDSDLGGDEVESAIGNEAPDGTTVWTETGSYNFEGKVEEPEQLVEEVSVIVPSTQYAGVVNSYQDASTIARLELNIGGDTELVRSFILDTSSIVFDNKSKSVVLPSSLESGMSVRILATGDTKASSELASVIVLGDSQNLVYSGVTGVENTETEVVLINEVSKRKYVLPVGATVKNALTGLNYSTEDFKSGDRVFFTESGSEPRIEEIKSDVETSKDGVIIDGVQGNTGGVYTIIDVEDAYVYPSAK